MQFLLLHEKNLKNCRLSANSQTKTKKTSVLLELKDKLITRNCSTVIRKINSNSKINFMASRDLRKIEMWCANFFLFKSFCAQIDIFVCFLLGILCYSWLINL
jgi:hypothetical protein